MCHHKETHTGKTVGDNVFGFKSRISHTKIRNEDTFSKQFFKRDPLS